MARRKKQAKPYLMEGKPKPTRRRATIADPPDRRVPEVRPDPLSPAKVQAHQRSSERECISKELKPVHAVLERWASTPYDGRCAGGGEPRLAQVSFGRTPSCRHVPLPDSHAELVDDVVRSSPGWAQQFVRLRYRFELSVTEIAQTLGMKRRESVSPLRNVVLAYYLGLFVDRGILPPGAMVH